MKRSDLFREYARVIDMCEGTGVEPLKCIKLLHVGVCTETPSFQLSSKHYEFALAIVEGKPVFKGDEIYFKAGRRYDWSIPWVEKVTESLTWKPRTFNLNGEVLPCPIHLQQDDSYMVRVWNTQHYFRSSSEMKQVMRAINKILLDARNS